MSAQGRNSHEVLLHGKDDRLVYYLCGYATNRKHYMAQHVSGRHKHVQNKFEVMARIIEGIPPEELKTTDQHKSLVDKPDGLICYICGFSTSLKVNMQRHITRNHEGVNVPEVMKKIFDGTGLREDHVEDEFLAQDPLVCYICGLSTPLKATMYQHIYFKHKNVSAKEILANVVIGKNLKQSKQNLKKDQVVCYLCGFFTAMESYMCEHISRKHQELDEKEVLTRIIGGTRLKEQEGCLGTSGQCTPICFICGYSTAEKANMYQHPARCHENIVVKDAVTRIYSASGSDGTIADGGAHLHRGIKTPTCYICSFSQKKVNMYSHLRKRHENVPQAEAMERIINDTGPEQMDMDDKDPIQEKADSLVCDLCGFSTASRVNLYNHLYRMHKGVDRKEMMPSIGGQVSEEIETAGVGDLPTSNLVCYICGLSMAKETNIYQHVWRMHQDVAANMKDAMARIMDDTIQSEN